MSLPHGVGAMNQFDPELFSRLRNPWRLRETALVDLKERIYPMRGNGNALAEFIRDMIAFANTARRRGQPAYILFGVDDDGNILPQGIRGQCTRVTLPPDWDDDDPARFEQQQNQISRHLHNVAERHVRPGINFDYVPGRIDDTLVSYLIIRPEPIPQPFEVRRKVVDRQTGNVLLTKGQCWKREGESKYEVPESDKIFLYRWTDVPYVSKTQWVGHLSILTGAFTDELSTYLDLSTQGPAEGISLDQRVDYFLASDSEQVLLLTGRPGTGKTRYLHRLVRTLAEVALQNLEATSIEQPQTLIPVYVSLSGYAAEVTRPFKQKVVLCLDNHGILKFNETAQPERILADRNLRFVICLDAFDEMEPRGTNVKPISGFLEEFPNLKIVVTSRPKALPPPWLNRYSAISIAPLSENDVYDYLAAHLEWPDRAYEFIRQNAELYEVMCVPLMLKHVTEYWQEFEQQTVGNLERPAGEEEGEERTDGILSPSIGNLTDQLFRRLLERERDEKDQTQARELEAVRQMESLSALALWMDGRYNAANVKEVRRHLRLKDITRLQNLGIIRTTEDGFCFYNQLVQAYFAALSLRHALRRGRTTWVVNRITANRSFWQDCLNILRDLMSIDPIDLDPLFQRVAALEA